MTSPASIEPVRPTDEQLIHGAAIAARLHLVAALDEIQAAIAQVRAKYIADLRASDPFTLLVAAEKVYRQYEQKEKGASSA